MLLHKPVSSRPGDVDQHRSLQLESTYTIWGEDVEDYNKEENYDNNDWKCVV